MSAHPEQRLTRAASVRIARHLRQSHINDQQRDRDAKHLLLRADMNALPIQESIGLPYVSGATGTDRFNQARLNRFTRHLVLGHSPARNDDEVVTIRLSRAGRSFWN